LNETGSNGPDVAREILTSNPRPTAVFAVSDHEALLIYEMAKELGIAIPGDLSIVGYADLDFSSKLHPPLTTMRQRPREIGRRAAELILQRLDADLGDSPPTTICVGAELVERDSTGPASIR
jgi:LacI family transcriptional regulator